MSHYTVGVITKNGTEEEVEKALAPFHEYESTGMNDEYVVDVDITNHKWVDDYIGEFEAVEDENEIDREGTHKWGYVVKKDGEIVKVVERTNPNAKWDWWTIGGRWSDLLPNNQSIVKDINMGIDKEIYDKALKEWDDVIEGVIFYNPEYFINNYKTPENYATQCATFGTYALLTPDGVWHAPGEMLSFGADTSDYDSKLAYRKLYKEKMLEYGDYILTIVDCHV